MSQYVLYFFIVLCFDFMVTVQVPPYIPIEEIPFWKNAAVIKRLYIQPYKSNQTRWMLQLI